MSPLTPTLLLDLDNTLLGNDIKDFLPAYFRLLADHITPALAPEQFIDCLLAATQQAIFNQDPRRTLQDTFEAHFYSGLGQRKETLQPAFEAFYREQFPRLRALTQPRPQAVELVEEALARSYHLAIATNPLFPRAAILQRLEWAGLSPRHFLFEVISDIESFHFAKPNPAFYAEMLVRMGWPEGPVVMVGDDPGNDIAPARMLGLATFWISDQPPPTTDTWRQPDAWGSLSQVLDWLDATPPTELVPQFQTNAALLAILKSTPAALGTNLADLSPASWHMKPDPQAWSITEVVCHLRDVEQEVNTQRIARILDEENPFLQGQDTDPWAIERQYQRQDGAAALSAFTAARVVNLSRLEPLDDTQWQRPARHTIFGPTQLHEIVNIIAGHDRLHVGQIQRLLPSR